MKYKLFVILLLMKCKITWLGWCFSLGCYGDVACLMRIALFCCWMRMKRIWLGAVRLAGLTTCIPEMFKDRITILWSLRNFRVLGGSWVHQLKKLFPPFLQSYHAIWLAGSSKENLLAKWPSYLLQVMFYSAIRCQ